MEGVRHTRYGYWLEEAGPVEADPAARGRHDGGRGRRRRRLPRPLDGVAAEGARAGLDVVVLEAGLAGHGPSGRNGGFVSTLWDDLPILRDRVGDGAGGRGGAGLRARRPRDRRVLRERGRRRVLPRRADARRSRRARRSSATGTTRRGLRGGRRAGGGAPAQRERGPRALRRAASSAARSCATSATVQPARLALGLRAKVIEAGVRLHERTPVRRLVAPTRSPTRDGDASRADAAVLAVNSATAGFHGFRHALAVASSHMVITEPVPDVIEEIGWTGGENIHDCRTLLHYLRTTSDGRIALGWGGGRMGFGGRRPRRLDIDPNAARTRARRPRPLLPAAPRPRGHARLGRPDRRLAHAPADLRLPRERPPRLRLHRQRRRPDLPRRRDPRPARARPPRRDHPARDRRSRPQALPARAAALGRRHADPRGARPRDDADDAGRRPDPLTRLVASLPRRLGLRLPR